MIILKFSSGKKPDLYFLRRSSIGPVTTPDIDKAKRFDTDEQAQSEAWHPLCFWKAIPAPEVKR